MMGHRLEKNERKSSRLVAKMAIPGVQGADLVFDRKSTILAYSSSLLMACFEE